MSGRDIHSPEALPGFSPFQRYGKLMSDKCPSREVLKHVTSRWGVLVIFALSEGTYRFSELRRKINGISEKMLAETLQALEDDGFVTRHSRPVVPPHVDYTLSPLGREMATYVTALADWIEFNLPRILQNRKGEAKAARPNS